MTYKLLVTETGKKSGRYHYQVVDLNGKIISERTSDREYVACTIDGNFYFGRLDLIGKGQHGRRQKVESGYRWSAKHNKLLPGQAEPVPVTPIAYK